MGVIAPPKVLAASAYNIRLAHPLRNGSLGFAPLNLLKLVSGPRIQDPIHYKERTANRDSDEGYNECSKENLKDRSQSCPRNGISLAEIRFGSNADTTRKDNLAKP
jgi:hypothetical protein